MKGWHAAFSALLVLFSPAASGADDPGEAARELARKTAAYAGRGELVTVSWRNISSLGSADIAQVRGAFETALREAGARISEAAPGVEARITLSENRSQYLLVAEVRKGEERLVWIEAWKRGDARGGRAAPGVTLERRLLWEQQEPILDVAAGADQMVVLSPSNMLWVTRQNGGWKAGPASKIAPAKPWPRDMRGRLRVGGGGFEAQLPGLMCRGSEPGAALDCKAGDEPWTLESGSRFLLLANFAADRNHFDGRITAQTGQRKTVAPFYSAAAVEEEGRAFWLLAAVDGRAQLFDAGWEPVASIENWGSDIVGTDARCGGGTTILATRAGAAAEGDAIQAYTVANHAAAPAGSALEFAGPVTALWPAGGNAVVTVVKDPGSGRHSAYLVSVVCGS